MTDVESVERLLEQFRRSMIAASLSPATVKVRVEVLGRVARDLGHPLELSADQVAGWLAGPGWSRWTRATYFASLRAFYVWAVDTDRLSASPMARMRRPRTPPGLPRPAPVELFHRLVAGPEPWRTTVLLAGYEGLRCAELCALRRQEVTEEIVTVIEGKGGKGGTVPTHEAVWKAVRDRPAGLLVTWPGGRAIKPEIMSAEFGRHVRSLGYNVTLHQFRHLFGTEVYRLTRDLLLTQRLMRHSSPVQTSGYAELVDTDRGDAIRRLSY